MAVAEKKVASRKELQDMITKALTKVKGQKENDICKYLPMDGGGYMHHFTLKKWKSESPKKLMDMIKQYIISKEPKRVPPKPRKPRGSRKRHDLISLTRRELEQVLGHLRGAGATDLISKLRPRSSLAVLKRQLTASVRKGEVDQELWHAYVDTINAQGGEKQEENPQPRAMIQTVNR